MQIHGRSLIGSLGLNVISTSGAPGRHYTDSGLISRQPTISAMAYATETMCGSTVSPQEGGGRIVGA